MAGCNIETGGTNSDTWNLVVLNKYATDIYGSKGFKNQLQNSLNVWNGTDTYIQTSLTKSITMGTGCQLYMEGSDIAVKNGQHAATSIFMPLGTDSITLSFQTSIKCSVKVHIRFIEITDPNHTWTINSFDDSAMGDDQLINQVLTFYDSTATQSRTFSAPSINGKEGYFIVLWAAADDIHASAFNPYSDYNFNINSLVKITPTNASAWLNRSKPYYISDQDDEYLIPHVIQSTIYDTCTVAGTRCDQDYKESGVRWRPPCSIEQLEIIYNHSDSFAFRYSHNEVFSTIESSATNKEFITVSDGTNTISSPNININKAPDGTNMWRIDVANRAQDTDYTVEIKYKNDTGDSPYESKKTFSIHTPAGASTDIDAPTLYFWSQDEATPDVIKTYFAQIDGAASYDLIVRDPGNNIVFNQNYVDTGTIGQIITISVGGLVFGNLYHFRLIANPDGGHTSGDDYDVDVLKTGWLAKTVINLIPSSTSITVDYTAVPNADNYIIKLRRDGYGQTIEYSGAYNSPYTINGLITGKGYTVTIDARDSSGTYQYSTEYEHTTTDNPVTYLNKPVLIYTNNGPVDDGHDNLSFLIKEDVDNAERYEIFISGSSYLWANPTTNSYDVDIIYGAQYTIKVKAYNDTYGVESESHETIITLHKKIMIIQPVNDIKISHGPNNDTRKIFIRVYFNAGNGGERLVINIKWLDGTVHTHYIDLIPNNSDTYYDYNNFSTGLPGQEFIVESYFEKEHPYFGTYYPIGTSKFKRFRTYSNTDFDNNADNHPTNPDRDNPNTTFGYGDGLGL